MHDGREKLLKEFLRFLDRKSQLHANKGISLGLIARALVSAREGVEL